MNRKQRRAQQKQQGSSPSAPPSASAARPGYTEAHSNRGNALNNLRRFAEAVANYDCALALKPDDAELHANSGVALAGQGAVDAARQDFARALEREPPAGADQHYSERQPRPVALFL